MFRASAEPNICGTSLLAASFTAVLFRFLFYSFLFYHNILLNIVCPSVVTPPFSECVVIIDRVYLQMIINEI